MPGPLAAHWPAASCALHTARAGNTSAALAAKNETAVTTIAHRRLAAVLTTRSVAFRRVTRGPLAAAEEPAMTPVTSAAASPMVPARAGMTMAPCTGSSTRHQAHPRTRRGRHPEPDRPGRAARGQRRPGRLQPRQARVNPLPRPPPGTAAHRSGHTGLLPYRSGTQPAHREHRALIASPTRDARPLSHKQPKRYITVTGAGSVYFAWYGCTGVGVSATGRSWS